MLDCILYITVKMLLVEKNVLPVSFVNKEKPDLYIDTNG
jgi:hypothetical protein